jgi:membrane protein
MMTARAVWGLLKDAGFRWWDNQGMRLGAAVAFYSMLSLAPLVVVVMAVAGLIFGREAAQGELVSQMRGLAGDQGAEVIQTLLANAYQEPGAGVLATVLGVAVLLFGAAGVFAELQDGLNTIWSVPPRPSGTIWAMVKARFLSFSMVLGVAFLLIVSLVVSAALAAVGSYAGSMESRLASVMRFAHLFVSMGLLGVLFALMFKFLPDARITWRDVWVGGMVTAALFVIGKYLIGLYLGSSSIGSAYGAAGSFAVFLAWAYYSAQIFFFGAAFTRSYADRFGSRVRLYGGQTAAAEPPAKRREEAALQV